MIESLSLKIAEAIKRADPDRTASVAVMKFSLEAILNSLVTLFFIIVVSLFTGKIEQALIGVLAFVILRFVSGGVHLRKALHCSLLSMSLLSVAPMFSLTKSFILIFTAVSAILLLIFAPSNIEGHARLPKKYFPALKLLSILIVCTNLVFMNSTISISHFFQAVSTIRLKKEVIKNET